MKNDNTKTQRFAILMFLLMISTLTVVPIATSVSSYVFPLQSVYGSGSCGTCHIDPGGGGTLNTYGTLFENQPNHAADPAAALIAIGAPPGVTTPVPTVIGTPVPTVIGTPVAGNPFVTCYIIRGNMAISIPPSTPGPSSIPTSAPIPAPTPVPTQGPPTVYANQISWAGYAWDVRSGSGGPGPNDWSQSSNNVWVDAQNRLHLKITNVGGRWYNVGISTSNSVGYGTYTFKMVTDPTVYPKNIVAGMFYWLWSTNRDELDIEFSQWNNANNPNTQYTVWTNDWVSNTVSPMYLTTGTGTTHKMIWSPNSIYFEGPAGSWTYPGSYQPHLGGTYAINLWVYDQSNSGFQAPADGNEQELILESFTYVSQ